MLGSFGKRGRHPQLENNLLGWKYQTVKPDKIQMNSVKSSFDAGGEAVDWLDFDPI